MVRTRHLVHRAGVVATALVAAGCGTSTSKVAVPVAAPRPVATASAADDPFSSAPTATPPVEVPPSASPPPTAPPLTGSVPSSTVASPVPTAAPVATLPPSDPSITLPPPSDPPRPPVDPWFGSASAAFEQLAGNAPGASMTIVSGGNVVFGRATGRTIDGIEPTSDSPMVVASVSKLVVAVAIARLHEQGLIDIAGPVPWADLGLVADVGWADVTISELLAHSGGLAKERSAWFNGDGTCRDFIPSLLTVPPNEDRGRWVYSNGNYCILGLLVEQRTGLALDQAVQRLAFDPVGVAGVHLTDGGLRPGDLPYEPGTGRLSRLGGAGTLVVSTDDLAMLFGRLTPNDLAVLQPPGVHVDQYGFGHTGTVDFAKSCVWLFDGGTTVVAATIAGESVSSGGGVCDIVVPAVASDLGIYQGRPTRFP